MAAYRSGAALVRNSSTSASPSGPSCFSNPSGISDFFDATSSSMSSRWMTCGLALGVDQLDRRLRLRRQQAVEDPAVGGGDGVLDEVPLDAPAGVEDVDQQLGLRVGRHAGQVGADLAPFAAVACGTWRTAGWKTSLPRAASPPRRTTGASSSITFWRSGSGRPPPLASRRFGPRGDRPVRMGGERLLLVERELVEPDLAPLDAVEQAPRPSRRGRAGRAGRRPGRRGQRRRG